MKKFSKKGVLLVTAAMAVCALAMPSMASAGSWTVVGSEHTLDSSNLGYTATTAAGTLFTICNSTSLTTNVASSANLEITAAVFGAHCTASFSGGAVCNMTLTSTGLPWTATAVTTSNIQIHGVQIDQRYDQSPAGTCPAFFVGVNQTITGTLSGVTYDNVGRELILNNAEGLVSHSALGANQPLTFRGTIRDTQQSLFVDN